jgi:hypothetical protein
VRGIHRQARGEVPDMKDRIERSMNRIEEEKNRMKRYDTEMTKNRMKNRGPLGGKETETGTITGIKNVYAQIVFVTR